MTDIEKNENLFELDASELEEVSGGKSKKTSNFIKTTGSVNVRKGAGLKYAIITALTSGTIVSYLGTTKKDDRGVAWYKININGKEGWVSSKYSKFN